MSAILSILVFPQGGPSQGEDAGEGCQRHADDVASGCGLGKELDHLPVAGLRAPTPLVEFGDLPRRCGQVGGQKVPQTRSSHILYKEFFIT